MGCTVLNEMTGFLVGWAPENTKTAPMKRNKIPHINKCPVYETKKS